MTLYRICIVIEWKTWLSNFGDHEIYKELYISKMLLIIISPTDSK